MVNFPFLSEMAKAIIEGLFFLCRVMETEGRGGDAPQVF
jgi:hypothetical protein